MGELRSVKWSQSFPISPEEEKEETSRAWAQTVAAHWMGSVTVNEGWEGEIKR